MASRDGQFTPRDANFNDNEELITKNASQDDVLSSSDASRTIVASRDNKTSPRDTLASTPRTKLTSQDANPVAATSTAGDSVASQDDASSLRESARAAS